MSAAGRWGCLVGLGFLLAGCRGKVEIPPRGISAECQGLAPLTLSPVQTRIRVNEAVTLVASGGSGRYVFGVQPGGSGGAVRGDRLYAGSTPGKDEVFVNDAVCDGNASARVEVMASFDVAPTRAAVVPGTTFRVATAGLVGYPQFRLLQNGSGASISPQGQYLAGPNEGLDVVEVRDTQSGDQAVLRFEISRTASFRAQPAALAVPAGSQVTLTTADGTDRVTWRKLSGPGQVDGASLTLPAEATGTVEVEAQDVFTRRTTLLRVRVLTELTRPTVPHGRLSDVASMVSDDFDGDGVADLAVGFAESDLNRPQGGAVFVFKGSQAGLPEAPTWTLTGDSDTAQLGSLLAAGDLDGDGKADLAVSSPGADITVGDSGAVYLYKFDANGPQPLRTPLTGLGRGNFGAGLAIADFDGDGNSDLWVGSPNGDLVNVNNRRGVIDLFASPKGGTINELPSVRLSGLDLAADGTAVSRANTNFGRAVLAADFNGDGRNDLAVLGQVNNSLLNGVPLVRLQPAIAVHFSRGGAAPFSSPADVYVLPTNTADGAEGTWRLGFVPAGEGRPPLLMAVADQADSPDLSSSGGVRSGSNAGGALLFDLSAYRPTGTPAEKPTQLGLQDAYARIYGDTGFINAGRSFALVNVDGVPGPELLLGAPYASPQPQGAPSSYRLGGRILAYGLANLARGTVANKPLSDLPGSGPVDCLGAGLAAWKLGESTSVAAVASRASTANGTFTGRVDAFTPTTAPLAQWQRRSVAFPAKPGVEQFGVAVAAGRAASGAPVALVAAPGFSGPGSSNDGNDIGAGRALLYDVAQPGAPKVAAQGAASPILAGGRSLASDVAFTDFDGDGRQDLLVGAPNLQVPSSSARTNDITPYYARENPGCITSSTQSVGGLQVHLGQADGTFKPAYRLWAPADIAGCTPVGTTACRRSGIGRGLAGGFDFNGDGKQDLAAIRTNGVEVFLGRAPDDATLGKLTMGCDPVYTAPASAQATSAPAGVGDLDGDGCDEVAYRVADTTRSMLVVLFGFDTGGVRCAGHTAPSTVRIVDRDAGLNFLGLGIATAPAGNFLGDGKPYVAVGATAFPLDGVVQNAVVLYDGAAIAARRTPSGGNVTVGALGDGLVPVPLVPRGPRIFGFGRSLAGNVDLSGDGLPDLLVGSAFASYAGDGTGAVYAYSGARGASGVDPFLVLTGDSRERSAFGTSMSLARGSAGSPPFLVVGAPSSYRTGTQNGTAYTVTLGF